MKKLFVIAGEESGDQHAAAVIRELHQIDPDIEVHGFGGNNMALAGAHIHYPLTDLACTGLPGIRQLLTLLRLRKTVIKICQQEQIHHLLLVDYPGFNLSVARFAHQAGMRVIYYIAPQVWAWRAGRLKKMKAWLDLVLVILPFEKDFLSQAGIPVEFVGHPLIESLPPPRSPEVIRESHQLPMDVPLVGLFPGSRRKEVEKLAPVLRQCAQQILDANPKVHFVVPVANNLDPEFVKGAIGTDLPITYLIKPSADFRAVLQVAITKSGTSTLENAFYRLPQVIVYRASWLTAFIARRVFYIAWLGLVNILAQREICPEFLQEDCVPEKIVPKVLALVDSSPQRQQMMADLESVRQSLGSAVPAAKVARIVADQISTGTAQ